MPQFTDQTGNHVKLQGCPQRIISIVPSQTELLHYLELDQQVIGITKFCVHPHQWHQEKVKIGGTKKLHLDKIRKLQPDLIIANKEENQKEDILQLQETFPVWISDIKNMDDAISMIESIGVMTCREILSTQLVTAVRKAFSHVHDLYLLNAGIPAAYLIWKAPYMVVGGNTFINELMRYCGLTNVFSNKSRYPEIDMKELQETGCRLVLLSSEPYPFREKHLKEFQHSLPGVQFILVDGQMFSWYGSRLLMAAEYFKDLILQIQSPGHADRRV